jgi:RNA polymerase sigma-70 factor, ECF subfamily
VSDDSTVAVFEGERSSLIGLAYRMLGSRPAAEDVVQDAWLRLAGTDAGAIENLRGWLRTVVTRLCLDQLRARAVAPTAPGTEVVTRRLESVAMTPGPEEIVEVADEVSRVLLLVLGRLTPTERVSLVLHDMFAVRYAEIGSLVGKSTEATKKLVGRARTKIRGTTTLPAGQLDEHRAVVTQFLEAARNGDLNAIMAVLAPDAVRTADVGALPAGAPALVRGAREIATGTVALAERSRRADLALIDGDIGLVVAPHGQLIFAVTFTVHDHRIAHYHATADPDRLARMVIGLPPTPPE